MRIRARSLILKNISLVFKPRNETERVAARGSVIFSKHGVHKLFDQIEGDESLLLNFDRLWPIIRK
jgi:hypothetical protein